MTKIVNNPPFTSEDGDVQGGQQQVEVADDIKELAEEQQTSEQSETSVVDKEEIIEDKVEVSDEVISTEAIDGTPSKIKVGEREFTEEELSTIVAEGTKVQGWKQKMPGFDIDQLMPDYTRKSQRLARYEGQFGKTPETAPKESLEELGVDQDQVNTFEKVAKRLGFVRQTDLVQNSVEAQKDAFLAHHKEYATDTPQGDARWNQLMEHFSIYNWQAHPQKVEELLEEAHQKVSQSWREVSRGEKVKETITTRKAQATAVAFGGGSSTSKPATNSSSNVGLADKYRDMGWTEDDIKELLT